MHQLRGTIVSLLAASLPSLRPVEAQTLPAAPEIRLSEPTTRPAIPEHPLLDFSSLSHKELRGALEKAYQDIFWSPQKSSPGEFVSAIATRLAQAGIDRKQSAYLLAASIEDGYMGFVERRDAIAALQRLFPKELEAWCDFQAKHDSPNAEGRIRQSAVDSSVTHGLLKFTVAYMDLEIPERETGVKIQVAKLSAKYFRPDIPAPERLDLGEFEFRPSQSGLNESNSFILPLNGVPEGQPFVAEFTLEVVPTPLDRGARDGSSVFLRRSYNMEPLPLADGKFGYRALPLGPDRSSLVDPAAVNVMRGMWYGAVVQAASIKQSMPPDEPDESPSPAPVYLLGREVSSLSVLRNPKDISETSVIDVSKGRWYLILGATWCGPCGNLAPRIEEVRSLFDNRILRLSLDERPRAQIKALDPELNKHPYDAVATGDSATLLHNYPAIPYLLELNDGKVIDGKVLTPKSLEELIAQRKLAGKSR